MKEAEQYLIYDGLIEDNSSEDLVLDTPEEVSIEMSEFEVATVDKKVTTNVSEETTNSDVNSKSQFKALAIWQCTEELISPIELSKMYGVSRRTIQFWVTSSGASLPQKYRKKFLEVSIPTNDQQSSSTSSSSTVFGDHSYTKTEFTASSEIPRTADSLKKVVPKTKLHCPIPMCNFETSRKNYLDSHIKSHITCEHCGEVLPGKKQLTVHMTKHKPKDKPKKQYLCDFCSKDCKCRQSKWRHMKTCKKRSDKPDPQNILRTSSGHHPDILQTSSGHPPVSEKQSD